MFPATFFLFVKDDKVKKNIPIDAEISQKSLTLYPIKKE